MITASQNTPSPGCSKSGGNLSPGISNETIRGRSYLLSIPFNYSSDTPTPLILSFHGGGQSPSIQLDVDQLTNPNVNNQYIVIYPEAVDTQWQVSPDSASDDLRFVSNILDETESTLCIDTSRTYATGKSQGGGMVGMLACDQNLSTRIAGFAPVSGAFYVMPEGDCEPDSVDLPCSAGRSDIPILEFHGGSDTVIPYYGDAGKREACLPTIPHWVQTWAKRNDLGTSNKSTSITKAATWHRFGTGSSLGLVSHVYDGHNVGHVWPATKQNARDTGDSFTASFDATPMILEFFGNYTLATIHINPAETDGNSRSINGSSSLSAGSRKVATVWWLMGSYIFQSLI
ncbi:hypothetical protein LA080_011079 [Diaporthe eres]|nr:hypothetical protein LA080_011079 [Diaporthe eres]